MAISDAAVVSRIRHGERDAFALLFERYYDRCARLAIRLLGDSDDADDAVQDAFIRAYLSLDSYQERDRFSSWLLCIVANRCKSAADTARRRATAADEWGRSQPDLTHATDAHADRDHALAHHLNKALGALPDATRAVVVRKYEDGASYAELSADTGIAISALKMRVARGSAQLRRTLVGVGISIVTVALIMVTHSHDSRRPRTATLVACDTLRTIMHDTLGSATRDSLLPPGRCGEASRAATERQAESPPNSARTRPEF
ncbi:MAG: RNA polymerase sigma factor [Gemmatimonadaceae bacterium]